jgi:hypothetical protein
VQVGHAADPLQVAGVGEGRGDGDAVGRLSPPVQIQDRVEDRGVHRPIEVVALEDLHHVGDGVLGEQHPAQHALLGGDVLRRRLVETAVPRRAAPAGRSTTARRSPGATGRLRA